MGGKSDGKIEIYEYAMSIHLGICAAGEGLQLLAVKYGDKEIWRGTLSNPTTLAIDKPDLHGGEKKEGGVKGLLWWLPGRSNQVMPETLAARLGLTSATCPGFRGLASIFLTGAAEVVESALQYLVEAQAEQPNRNKKGFYLGANNPYLRKISVRARRPSIGLNPAKAMIRIEDDSNGNQQYASNAAHILYECLTNTDWGLGESPAVINFDSYEAAADTLYEEKFGLSILWTRQSKIEDFMNDVASHINAALYVDPAIGKHTIKLLRADYDPDALPEINPGNAKLTSFKRKMWGEIANEVVVTYTNAETGKDDSVTAQDLAGIAAEGSIISSGRNYHGINSKALATTVAERELAASVNPIATCEAEVSREFWDANSADCFRLSWSEYDIEQIIVRASVVSKGASSVKLSLYEDIFGLDLASYLSSEGTGWVNPSQQPQPASFYQVGTAPAFLMSAALGLTDPSELVYPEVLASVTVGADSDDDVNFDLVSHVSDVNGTLTRQVLGTRSLRGTWVLLDGLADEAQSTLDTTNGLPGLRGAYPAEGDFLLIGTGADDLTELVTVQSIDNVNREMTLNRGMLDTVPRAWAAGSRVFVIPPVGTAADPTIRSALEDASYWFQTRTTLGVLPLDSTPQVNVSLTERPYRPTRPANVRVNGVGFGTVNAVGSSQLAVTWANRNRVLESTQAMKWTESNVSGEAGQTTKIVVKNGAGVTLQTYAGLTGTGYDVPVSALGGSNSVTIEVHAERNGLQSLQGKSLTVVLV